MSTIGNCPPVAATFDPLDPCQRYLALDRAYLELISGGNRVRLRFGDRDAEYGRGDAELLRRERDEAEILCRRARGVRSKPRSFSAWPHR